MDKIIRIGTRESLLARWQAGQVLQHCQETGIKAGLVTVKSEGDLDTSTPLYELGVQGIFTRALDQALLNEEIDLAVHSFKDVPTQLAQGLQVAAVLKRASPYDVLVYKEQYFARDAKAAMKNDELYSMFIHRYPALTIATGSIRRKAQWLHHFPSSGIQDIRGNIQTRLRKLQEANWEGAIFAAAGLDRMEITNNGFQWVLDWMVPAPAQGAIVVVCRKDDQSCIRACRHLHDEASWYCTKTERDFLRLLQGGCSKPISALAVIENNELIFKGNISSPEDGRSVSVELRSSTNHQASLAQNAFNEMLTKGGVDLLG